MIDLFGMEISPAMLWLAAGCLLLLLEVSTGTLWVLWPGLAALALAVIAGAAPEFGFGVQILLFAAISVVLTLLGQRYLEARVKNRKTDRPHLNDRRAQLKGQRVAATGPFENGYGSVRLGDGQWGARLEEGEGSDIVAGAPLVILDVEGSILVVRRVEPSAA